MVALDATLSKPLRVGFLKAIRVLAVFLRGKLPLTKESIKNCQYLSSLLIKHSDSKRALCSLAYSIHKVALDVVTQRCVDDQQVEVPPRLLATELRHECISISNTITHENGSESTVTRASRVDDFSTQLGSLEN